MPERLRATDKDGNVYTVMEKAMPKRGHVEVRNAHGFRVSMPVKSLTVIEDKLKF